MFVINTKRNLHNFFNLNSVSRDRETTDSASGVAGAVNTSSNIRFRNQSPSTTHRKSRERERLDKDQNTTSESTLNASDMTADHTDVFDESRGSGREIFHHISNFV